MEKITDVETYMSGLSEEFRTLLSHVRQIIKRIVPQAEEVMSYGMPAYKYLGMLVYFAAHKKHCAMYPITPVVLAELGDEIKDFQTSKATLQFTPKNPLPDELIEKFVKIRVIENEMNNINKKKKKLEKKL